MSSGAQIYLDHAASSPRRGEILRATEDFALHHYANVGRGRYDLAEESDVAYAKSKRTVSEWIGCLPVEVLYTYSATYGINLLALALEHNKVIQSGDTILLSVSEHHANILPWQMLAQRTGAQVKFIGLDEHLQIDLIDLQKKLDDTVKVVSLQYASNVTGAIHPLGQVREIIGDRLFFIDAAQMGIHGPINMSRLGADALVLSGHKMLADTGIGVLALRRDLQKSWQSPVSGGGAVALVSQETFEQAGIPERWEPGTPHITGAVSLGVAINYLSHLSGEVHQKYADLVQGTDRAFRELAISGRVQVFHSPDVVSLGIWSFYIPGRHVHDIADALAHEGICVRSGHHCCQPLHQFFEVPGTVRVSLGFENTQEEIEQFFQVLEEMM